MSFSLHRNKRIDFIIKAELVYDKKVSLIIVPTLVQLLYLLLVVLSVEDPR